MIHEHDPVPQPDPVTPAPTHPQLRVLDFSPPVRDLVTVVDGIDGVRRLVQRHGAASVQRWLTHVVTLDILGR